MKKPVAFIIFNRPDTTKIVFEEIQKYQPEQLFVIADGPRSNKENENKLCEQARNIIQVDWKCEVTKIYSDINLGCQKRISSGLDHVFEQVEDAIILEDDCVPHEDFFTYCQELLDYYKDEERIMAISGDNFQKSEFEIEESYYYSIFPHCWGWATWKKKWGKMDVKMRNWPTYKKSKEFDHFCYDPIFKAYWNNIFDEVCDGKIDSWAYPWTFSCWYNKGLTVLPKINLVSNIGFSENATHTTEKNELLGNLPIYGLEFPLKHPSFIKQNFEADFYTSEYIYNINLFKSTFLINNLKIKLFETLLNKQKLKCEIFKKVYIFGTGNLGRNINKLLKIQKYNVVNFVVSNVKEEIIDNLEVISIDDINNNEEATVIVTIEGSHDSIIIETLNNRFNDSNLQVISWKELI